MQKGIGVQRSKIIVELQPKEVPKPLISGFKNSSACFDSTDTFENLIEFNQTSTHIYDHGRQSQPQIKHELFNHGKSVVEDEDFPFKTAL